VLKTLHPLPSRSKTAAAVATPASWHVAVSFCLLVAFGAGCGRHTKRELAASSAAPSTTEPAPIAALALSQMRLELGELLPNTPSESLIELSNIGTTVVRFRESSTSNRCQWLQPLSELPAGAKVQRKLRCQSDLVGPLKEQLTLTEERPRVAPTTLEITASIVPLLAFDTSFIDLRPAYGKTAKAQVTVIGAKVKAAKLAIEPAPESVLHVTALPVSHGAPPRFQLTCRGTRVGMHAGSLVARTGLTEPAVISVSWGCRVPGTLEVNPSSPYFNLKVSGEKAVTVSVKSSQAHFEIRRVFVKEGPFAASLQARDADGTYAVSVKVLNEKIADETRSASGTLVIESNDAREPHKEVPLFGFGQINKVQNPQ
jgi:hypothetical protein